MEQEKKEERTTSSPKTAKISKKKLIFVIISALVLLLLSLLIIKLSPQAGKLNLDEAKTKAESFINDNLMLPGTKATIKEIKQEYGLYKLSIDLGDAGTGELIDSYISQDGLLFFPQSINIEEYENSLNGNGSSATTEVISKSQKPNIELFVMSHCPYGTQIEKGLIPVLKNLGNSVDFTLKFNSYTMHDKAELDEQLTQYCVQKENKDKLLDYLSCFVGGQSSDSCLSQVGINKNTIAKCVSTTDQEYKITDSYNDQTTWLNGSYPIFPIFEEDNNRYGVQGSPTLVINGEFTSSARDSQSLLNLICSAFETAPDSCQAELSSLEPSYGFGE